MSKHPPKGVTGLSKHLWPAPISSKAYQIRSLMSIAVTNKSPAQHGQQNVSLLQTPGETYLLSTLFHKIADKLTIVINSATICPAIKFQLEAVIQYINNARLEEVIVHEQKGFSTMVSEQLPATKEDIEHLHSSLTSQIKELRTSQILQLNGVVKFHIYRLKQE